MEDGDRYFDSQCEYEHVVSPLEFWSNYVPSSQRKFHGFDSFSADVALALLHVSRRTFHIEFSHLISFLQGISLRRHLIKDIEVSDFSSYDKQSCSQTFSLLQTLDGLRSFTIAINNQPLKLVLEHLVDVGIHDLTDRMDVTLLSELVTCMPSAKDGVPKTTSEIVVFTNACKCAKGEREWKSQEVHCWVHLCGLAICDSSRAAQENLSSQVCDHDRHRLIWQYTDP